MNMNGKNYDEFVQTRDWMRSAINKIKSSIALKFLWNITFDVKQGEIYALIDDVRRAELRKMIGVENSEITRALKILKSDNLVVKKGCRYYINPRVYYRGQSNLIGDAIAKFDEICGINLETGEFESYE